MTNKFANYTRSTAFSMSLSSKMIDRLLSVYKVGEVASRYDWWQPPTSMFGTGPDSTRRGTDRALTNRGMLAVGDTLDEMVGLKDGRPKWSRPTVELTEAGELTARLLIVAGFEPPAPLGGLGFGGGIPAHVDDLDDLGGRHVGAIRFETVGDEPSFVPFDLPRDRRLDLWEPGDEHYYFDVDLATKVELDRMVEAARIAAAGVVEAVTV